MLKKVDTVNVEEILALADFLEFVVPDKYNQSTWEIRGLEDERGCGTPGCIAGWQNYRKGRSSYDASAAAKDLGLSELQALNLFAASAGCKVKGLSVINPEAKDAARCLRELAMTGKVPEWWGSLRMEE